MTSKNFKIKRTFLKKNGVYVEENGILAPWTNPLNMALKTANINVAHFLKTTN
jgi:hypothetical protein